MVSCRRLTNALFPNITNCVTCLASRVLCTSVDFRLDLSECRQWGLWDDNSEHKLHLILVSVVFLELVQFCLVTLLVVLTDPGVSGALGAAEEALLLLYGALLVMFPGVVHIRIKTPVTHFNIPDDTEPISHIH